MSFVRPALAARLRPLAEPAAWAALTLCGLWLIWQGYTLLAPLPFAAGLLMAGAGAALLHAALRRQRLQGDLPAEGIVTLDEARIGYLGPFGGGFIDLDTLVAAEIVTRAAHDRLGPPAAWVLAAEDGTVLHIPFGAEGSERIYDALSPLPGVDYDTALRALETRTAGRHPVWLRPRPDSVRLH
jgi:hypothetical protein